MKTKQYRPAFWMVVIPSLLLIACLMFFTPPTLELYTMSRAEDTDLPIYNFHFFITDHSLNYNQYTVSPNGDGLINVSRKAAEADFAAVPDSIREDRRSALTVAQMESLVKPIWRTMQRELPDYEWIEAMFIAPVSINESPSVRRSIEMTLSVSTGKITELEKTYSGKTELGGVQVSAINMKDNVAVGKFILLVD